MIGLGCKCESAAASAPAVIRSAAQWDTKKSRRDKHNNNKKKKKKTTLGRNQSNYNNNSNNNNNVVVDVPDVCCAPPGIGSASDVHPRPRTNTQRPNHREQSRVHRRAANSEEITRNQSFNTRNYPRGGLSEIVILRQNIIYARNVERQDQYGDWRLDVDHMGYEELLELGDRIGYVGTGLGEERILQFLKKVRHSNNNSEDLPLLDSNYDKDWSCSICQVRFQEESCALMMVYPLP